MTFYHQKWRRTNIYNAPNKEVAATELDNLEKKWRAKYPYTILSWKKNWDDLTVFFQFSLEIKNIIYTTNLLRIWMEKLESILNLSSCSHRMMSWKRRCTYLRWRLRRNGRSQFITGAWLWTNLCLLLKTKYRYKRKLTTEPCFHLHKIVDSPIGYSACHSYFVTHKHGIGFC